MTLRFPRRHILRLSLAAASLNLPQASYATDSQIRVAVRGFGSAALLGAYATEESLSALLIDMLLADGRWSVIDDSGGSGDTALPAGSLLLRAAVTRYESSGGSGLDVRGVGALMGHASTSNTRDQVAISLRLVDPKSKEVLAVANGSGVSTSRTSGLDASSPLGSSAGANQTRRSAVEQAVRTALRQAISALWPKAIAHRPS